MSEQEKKTGGTAAGGSSVVLVEQSTASRHKQPYRPTELQEEPPPDPQHKRTKAPAVPSVTEDLKDSTDSPDTKERRECERAMSSEKYKHSVAKKLSSSTKRRATSPEAITLAPLEVETRKGTVTPPPKPIPSQVSSVTSAGSQIADKAGVERNAEEEDITEYTEEVTELRTPEAAKQTSEWSDDEEAGGLPRSESRASRVSRVVRQLFCCGVRYDAPSEDDVSSPRFNDAI